MAKFVIRTPPPFTRTVHARQVPDNLWERCPGCRTLIYRHQLSDNALVCPHCAFHFRMTAAQWAELLLDRDSLVKHAADRPIQAEVGSITGEPVLIGSGTIAGLPLEIAISDFQYTGDGRSSRYGEQVACSADHAVQRGVPLLTVHTCMSMRLGEGILALMQMTNVSSVLAMLARSRQPHIAIVGDVCHSSVWTSYVAGADVILAEPGAYLRFDRKVAVEQQREFKLGEESETGAALLQQGLIDDIVPRAELRKVLSKLLRIYHG